MLTSHIYRILNNHTYIGEVKYKDNICEGEHDAILELDVWNRTREILAANDHSGDRSRKQEIIAPLRSILRCGHCNCAMMPTYSRKNGRKYYYYLCRRDAKRAQLTCPVHQIPAGDIEEIVKKQLKKFLSDPSLVVKFAEKSGLDTNEILDLFCEEFWNEISPGEYNRLVTLLVERGVVWENKFEIEFKTSGVKTLIEEMSNA